MDEDWENVWEDRIETKIDVDELVEFGSIEEYLESKLEDGFSIPGRGGAPAHFVETKPQLMANIGQSQSFQDIKKVKQSKTKTEKGLKSIKGKISNKIALDLVDRKIIESLKEKGEAGRVEFREFVAELKRARDGDIASLGRLITRIAGSETLSDKNRSSLIGQADAVRDIIQEAQ